MTQQMLRCIGCDVAHPISEWTPSMEGNVEVKGLKATLWVDIKLFCPTDHCGAIFVDELVFFDFAGVVVPGDRKPWEPPAEPDVVWSGNEGDTCMGKVVKRGPRRSIVMVTETSSGYRIGRKLSVLNTSLNELKSPTPKPLLPNSPKTDDMTLSRAVVSFRTMTDDQLNIYAHSPKVALKLTDGAKRTPRAHIVQIVAAIRSEHKTGEDFEAYCARLKGWPS